MKMLSVLVMIAMLGPQAAAAAQEPAQGDIWRAFAQKIDAGTRVKVRLDNGQRVSATLIEADAEGLLLQPRTRLPVPIQRIAYDRIASLERDEARGIGAGKAVAIGVASGVGAFLGALLILIATID
jgi:hypothetical protein